MASVPAPSSTSPSKTSTPIAQTQAQQSGGISCTSLSKMGQEQVQEIVSKTTDLFTNLKAMQLPGTDVATQQQFLKRKSDIEECTKAIREKFKYLHIIYDRLNEFSAKLGPMIDVDHMAIVSGENYREVPPYTNEEHRRLVEQIELKNTQLKELIDKLRVIIWELNSMLAMRKSLT